MAQVKKFQAGGGLLLNGKTYTAEQINEYLNQSGMSSQERAAISGTVNAIASGKQRSLDRNANSISGDGIVDDFASFYGSEKKAGRNSTGRSTRWSNRQARKNSDSHIANTAISKLGGIEDYYNKKNKSDESKVRLYAGNDANGFYTSDGRFLEGPENHQNISRINAIFDALDKDLTTYDLQDWSGDVTLGGLTDWWKSQNGQFDRDAFFTRMRNNQLDDTDWEILGKMGFDRSNTNPSLNTSGMHADWKGNLDSAKNAGVYMTKDKDGNWFINSQDDNNSYLGQIWYGGGLDFLSGTDFSDGMIGSDGRLYTRQDILNGKYQNVNVNDFLMAGDRTNWRDWYDAANASGVRFVGDRISTGGSADDYGVFNTQFNPYTHYNNDWYNYFSKLGNIPFDIVDMSKNFGNLNGRQVVAYVDPDGSKDAMGIRGVKYAIRNSDGSYNTYDSEEALINGAGLTMPTQWWTTSPPEFKQSIWENIGGKQYSLAHELNIQGNQQNIVMQDKDGNFFIARKDASGNHVSPKLIKNVELLQQILENPQNYNNSDIEKLYAETEDQRGKRQTTQYTGYGGGYISGSGWGFRKEGGTIPKIKELPKFQYGGAVGKSKTTSKVQSTEGLRTDITSSHKLNGSDGGLTKAEKAQIAAAIGDLAGVGLSFVPGAGNIAGAALGLGSTATRFVSDVKKDGFQAKDAWSAAGGTLLDLATIIPGLGTGAKTAKAVKAIKAAATPIMKVLSLAGAAQGVSAMGKVMRGEEITSEDLTAIISGLGSTAIAGKQLKDTIGDAKLAKKLATSAAKSANAANDSELVGTTLQKTRKEIANLIGDTKSEKEVVGKVHELLKQTNPEATTADARKVLQEWGVETSRSRFSGKNGWKEYLQFWKKGEKQVSFELPKEQEAGSTLYYMLNPYARLKQTGFDWGYVQKNGNLKNITSSEVNAANAAVASRNATLEQQALSRQTIDNPRAFWDNNITLGETTTIPGFYMGGNRYFRTASDFTTRGLNDVEVAPQPGRSGDLLRPIDNTENADVLRRRAAIREYKLRKFLQSNGLFVEPETLALPMPSAHAMKVSRLVPRGNTVITPDVIIPGPLSTTIDPNGMLARQLDLDFPIIGVRPYSRKNFPIQDLPIGYGRGKYDEAIQYMALKNGGKISKLQFGNKLGEVNTKKFPVNTAFQIEEALTQGLTAFNANERQLDLAKRTKPFTEQGTTFVSNRIQDPGFQLAANKAIEQRNTAANKMMTPDLSLHVLNGIQAANDISQIILNTGNKQSAYRSDQLDKQIARSREDAVNNAALANRNLQRWNAWENSLLQQEGASIAQKLGITQGLTHDLSTIGQNAMAGKKALANFDAKVNYINTMDAWKKEFNNKAKNGLVDGMDYETWLNNNHKTEHQALQRNFLASQYIKQGGKVRSAKDQIKIDNNKIRAKAIEQLSKQAFEFLKQALS